MVLVAYADCSIDKPLISVGYVLYRHSRRVLFNDDSSSFLDAGSVVFDMREDPSIDEEQWDSEIAEYYAAVVATRQASMYDEQQLQVCLDNQTVVEYIQNRSLFRVSYLEEALYEALELFDSFKISYITREENDEAHARASYGLRIGRDLMDGQTFL